MADQSLSYIVEITHRDKGVGFSAREALQNAQRAKTSPIQQARFLGIPTGSNTRIEVIVSDTSLREAINQAIHSSSRLHDNSYDIESIELQGNKENIARIRDLETQLATLNGVATRLRQKSELRGMVSTPLEGLLAYFESTTYSPEVILEDSAELDFARQIFRNEGANTFIVYANHVLGEKLTEDEVENILAYKLKSTEEMRELQSQYEVAKGELQFLNRLKEGKTEVPETLRQEYTGIIEAKNHEQTLQKYESIVQEQETHAARQARLLQLQEKYVSFSERISLLTGAGSALPVIFSFGSNPAEIRIYFPFRARDIKSGFIGDLKQEISRYFPGSDVEQAEHKFIAYKIDQSPTVRKGVEEITQNIPVSLRVAGFSAILPYCLG